MSKLKSKVVLAFSGGLDTSYCAVWLREQGYEVHTATIQTGGFDADELRSIEQRAKSLGVASHLVVDATDELFQDYLRFLIFANALRGDVYPLSVSAERTVQARRCVEHALEIGAEYLAHGSTGAGNDQVRFDVAFRVLAPQVKVLTPIRDQALSRAASTAYLQQRGIDVPAKTSLYSINRGLWGTTIGGGPTHATGGQLPDDAYVMTAAANRRPAQPHAIEVEFENGVPVSLDSKGLGPVALLTALNEIGGQYGIGRGMHVGDTILGIKGRVAFEAPAAVMLIAAHRELEKITLSRQQQFWKRTLGELYGQMMHEARYFDPLMRDLEAFLASSQRTASGKVQLTLTPGVATVTSVSSPFTMLNAKIAVYGEGSSAWTGAEAAAFSRLYGMQDYLAAAAAREGADAVAS